MAEVQEVRPEVIDAPEVISGADRWLAEQRARVAEIAEEYRPHEITSGEDYRESKRARTQARKAIKEVEDARRAQVGAIKDAVRDFEAQVRDLLEPLSSVDADYKAALAEWERLAVESRTQEVAAWYAETQGDVARLVPFETVWARYAHTEKWDLYGANLVQIEQDVAGVMESIEHDLETLDSAPYADEDKANAKAEYLRTLDLSEALRSADDARRRRERMAEVERQRAERMAAEAPEPAADAPTGRQDAASAPDVTAPGQAPTAADAAPQADAGRPIAAVAAPGRVMVFRVRVMVFRVTVPEERAREFVAAMRAIPGVHGGPWHDERTSE